MEFFKNQYKTSTSLNDAQTINRFIYLQYNDTVRESIIERNDQPTAW